MIGKFQRRKAALIVYTLVFGFITAIILLVRWQIFDSERFQAIANERYREIRIPSVRGSILASDGSTLAYSEPRFDVFVWLPELEQVEKNSYQTRTEFLDKVAPLINITPKRLSKLMNSGPSWIKIASEIKVLQRERLLNLKTDANPNRYIQGLQFEYVSKRIYPEASMASHIIGFLGKNNSGNNLGISGIEQYWDGSLKPFEGFELGEFDSFGNPITLDSRTQFESRPGDTLYTTIDKVLQSKLEDKVKFGYERYGAKSVTGIIMDPKTGAILALANYPNYDPNYYFEVKDGNVFGNNAITIPYEIGSVAKVFTLAAAFDQNKLEPSSLVLPEGHNGCEIITPNADPNDTCAGFEKRSDIQCICTYDKKPNHESLTAAKSLVNSDNIAFRHIALTMEYEEFYNYLVKFGVSSLTGIDLAGESNGLLKNYKEWNYADQAVFSYGHGFQITPIQAIAAIGSIPNNGLRMQPYVVSKIENSLGEERIFQPRIMHKVVAPKTASNLTTIMHDVFKGNLVEERYKYLEKYYIGLKSGTALIPYRDRAGYSGEINATYVGFDASPQKKFVLLIKVEEPNVGDLSFYNARTLWLDTFIEIKDYLGVPEFSG